MKNRTNLVAKLASGGIFTAMRLLAVIGILVVSPTRVLAAGVVFSDGFEDGTISRWSPSTDRIPCPVVRTAVDGATPHSGSYMAECNWNGTLPSGDPAAFSELALSSWSYKSEFLIRLWVRIASDVDHLTGAKILRLFPNGGKHDQLYMQAYMNETPQYLFHDWLLNDVWQKSFWGDHTSIGDGSWHKIEIYIKQNDPGLSNGIVRTWKDSKLEQEILNVVSISPGMQWGMLHLMSNWSNPHDANNHSEWDDVEIYSDLGSGATGSMSDASITTGLVPQLKVTAGPKSPNSVSVKYRQT